MFEESANNLPVPSIEKRGAPEGVEKPGDLATANQVPDWKDNPAMVEARVAAITSLRESELQGLNAARAALNMGPTDRNVATDALDAERAKLAGRQGNVENSGEQKPEAIVQIEDKNDEHVPGRPGELIVPGLEAGLGLTKEIRYYFQNILGPEETVKRLGKMKPETLDIVRGHMKNGKLGELVMVFTDYDERLQKIAQEMDKDYNAEWETLANEVKSDPYRTRGEELNRHILSGPPSKMLYDDEILGTIGRVRKATKEEK